LRSVMRPSWGAIKCSARHRLGRIARKFCPTSGVDRNHFPNAASFPTPTACGPSFPLSMCGRDYPRKEGTMGLHPRKSSATLRCERRRGCGRWNTPRPPPEPAIATPAEPSCLSLPSAHQMSVKRAGWSQLDHRGTILPVCAYGLARWS
jgi:hypothetical protein